MVEVDMNLGNLPADKYEDIKAADQARVAVRIKLDSGNLRNQDTVPLCLFVVSMITSI